MRSSFEWYCRELMIKESSFKNKIVVDIGCGPWGSLHFFKAKMKFGVDNLAHEYQKEFKTQNHDMVYLNCHSHKIPLLDNFADAVISNNALDHVDNFEKTIQEIYRILKPKGKIILNFNLRPFSLLTEPQILSQERINKVLKGKFKYKIIRIKKPSLDHQYMTCLIKGYKK